MTGRRTVLPPLAGLLVACASGPDLPTLTPALRAELQLAAVEVTAPAVKVELMGGLGEGPVSGFFSGLGAGSLIGMHPWALVAGGPLVAGPIGAWFGLSCGRALGTVDEPVKRLQALADATGLAALHAGLAEMPVPTAPQAAASTPAGTHRLEVTDVVMTLSCGSTPHSRDGQQYPELQARAVWRVVPHGGGGPVFRPQVAECKLEDTQRSFATWYAEPRLQATELRALLQALGRQVVLQLGPVAPQPCSVEPPGSLPP